MREANRCVDFRPNSNAKAEEQWSPEGYSWYGGELITNRTSRYTQSEQTEILNSDLAPRKVDVLSYSWNAYK